MLVQHEAGAKKWGAFESHLRDRAMTLREVLAAEASLITCSFEEADAYLAEQTRFDPAFAAFVQRARTMDASVTILSSGVQPLIESALRRNGIEGVPVRANGVDPRPDGWVMLFRDASENGHDKAADVREAKARGARTVYIGDGFSDFEAAVEAERRFAKTGRSLIHYLRERGLPFTEFSSFTQVTRALFS